MVELKIEFDTEEEAQAFSQLIKRIYLSDVNEKSSSKSEMYTMFDAINSVQKALFNAGYNPR